MHLPGVRSALGLLALICCAAAPTVAADFSDPDWPCIQRKVPALSLAQMWSGPLSDADWRDDPALRTLAAALAARRTSLEEAETLVTQYAEDIPATERGAALSVLVSGVIDLIDAERAQLIDGIGRYAHNQTALSTRIETLQAELTLLEAAADPDKDLDRIEEVADTVEWEARIFRDRAQALTYVCETPVLMEQRAFAIARMAAGLI